MAIIKCGHALTEDCFGDTDHRYDPDASNNLKDQSVVWQKMEGLWIGDIYQYGSDYLPKYLADHGPYKMFPYLQFENMTIDDTRFHLHLYSVFGSDIPNVPGQLSLGDINGHSTYEKDGSIRALPLTFTVNNLEQFTRAPPANTTSASFSYPIGDNAYMTRVQGLTVAGDHAFWYSTRTCLDYECTKYSASYETFRNGNRTEGWTGVFEKVSLEEWEERLNKSYADANVQPEAQSPVPMEDECLVLGHCRTDGEYCESGDPSCSESPYKEPAGKVKPGVIAAFTIGGLILLVALMCLGFWRFTVNRDKRNRTKFAARVAENLSIKKSARSLTPTLLEKEFNKIDKEHGSRITKDALWEFLNSGKAGEMTQSDFNALFAVMDVNNSGYVDFLEFCAYMGRCHDEFNVAVRSDARNSTSARLSMARSVSIKIALEPAEEGVEGKEEEEA